MATAAPLPTSVAAEGCEVEVPLNRLREWAHNPRKTRDDTAVATIAANMAYAGQLLPLIIYQGKKQKLFDVIDGETRRRGFNLNADNGTVAPDVLVRCFQLSTDTTEAQLRAIALAANTIRNAPNPIEEMEAFHSLAKSGMKISAIAEMFGLDQRQVKQRLALGDLVESARDLVRSGKRQMGWAQAMTLGTTAQQERVVAEIHANNGAFADGSSVKADFQRGQIPVSSALFDPAELDSCRVVDLFSQDAGYFSDVDAFWKRQQVEIDAKIEELKTTHKDVRFINRQRFDEAGWTRGGVEADSVAVVIAHDDGSVEILTGMIPPASMTLDEEIPDFLASAEEHYAQELDASSIATAPADPASGPTSNATPPAANDTGASSAPAAAPVAVDPLANASRETTIYLTAQIVASLRLAVANDPRFAKAVLIAGNLTRRGPVSAMQIGGTALDAKKQTANVFDQLQRKRVARDAIMTAAGIAGVTSPGQVISKLLALPDAALDDVFAWTIADGITAGIDVSTAEIFDALGMEMLSGWEIEQAYLTDLTTPQVRALASQVIDPAKQPSANSKRSQIEKAILDSDQIANLAGNFNRDKAGWFPPQVASVIDQAAAKREAAAASAADLPQAA